MRNLHFLQACQYSFVCCKLKSGSESILIHYYTTLLNNVDENPILIDSLDSKSQREWEKIFEPIDAHPYEVGNLLQEFLFAMRAVAREYTVRKAMQDSLEE